MSSARVAIWTLVDRPGMEFVSVRLASNQLLAQGVAIGTHPLPYRIDYELETTSSYITSRLFVRAEGVGWDRSLELRRREGHWSIKVRSTGDPPLAEPGGRVDEFEDALDVDLAQSALTNLMPVMRHRLLDDGDHTGPLAVAWVSVPDLATHRSIQQYTFVRKLDEGRTVVRFEGSGPWGADFVADITFDPDGLVSAYPGIAMRTVSESRP